jgi:hypothetical protein
LIASDSQAEELATDDPSLFDSQLVMKSHGRGIFSDGSVSLFAAVPHTAELLRNGPASPNGIIDFRRVDVTAECDEPCDQLRLPRSRAMCQAGMLLE